jgi:hypothetical protein
MIRLDYLPSKFDHSACISVGWGVLVRDRSQEGTKDFLGLSKASRINYARV